MTTVTAADMVPCPHCAEPIKTAAKICRHCRRPLDSKSAENTQTTPLKQFHKPNPHNEGRGNKETSSPKWLLAQLFVLAPVCFLAPKLADESLKPSAHYCDVERYKLEQEQWDAASAEIKALPADKIAIAKKDPYRLLTPSDMRTIPKKTYESASRAEREMYQVLSPAWGWLSSGAAKVGEDEARNGLATSYAALAALLLACIVAALRPAARRYEPLSLAPMATLSQPLLASAASAFAAYGVSRAVATKPSLDSLCPPFVPDGVIILPPLLVALAALIFLVSAVRQALTALELGRKDPEIKASINSFANRRSRANSARKLETAQSYLAATRQTGVDSAIAASEHALAQARSEADASGCEQKRATEGDLIRVEISKQRSALRMLLRNGAPGAAQEGVRTSIRTLRLKLTEHLEGARGSRTATTPAANSSDSQTPS